MLKVTIKVAESVYNMSFTLKELQMCNLKFLLFSPYRQKKHFKLLLFKIYALAHIKLNIHTLFL